MLSEKIFIDDIYVFVPRLEYSSVIKLGSEAVIRDHGFNSTSNNKGVSFVIDIPVELKDSTELVDGLIELNNTQMPFDVILLTEYNFYEALILKNPTVKVTKYNPTPFVEVMFCLLIDEFSYIEEVLKSFHISSNELEDYYKKMFI